MRTTVDQLAAGDTIRLPRDVRILTLAENPQPHETAAHILRLTFRQDDAPAIDMPAAADIDAVSMPRTAPARCLTCRGTYCEEIDLTDGVSNLRGICGPCSARTTARVLKQRAAAIRRSGRRRSASGR